MVGKESQGIEGNNAPLQLVEFTSVLFDHGSAALDEKTVSSIVASFLNIQTIVKATDCRGSHLESVINRIVQQNVAAKVQPITSFGWSSILRSVSGSAERVQQTTFEEALQCYNNHPDVVSHDRADSGSGSIALDGRKRQGVRNWMERTCSEAYEEVLKSCHDIAFNLGPFGEVFSYTNICFLRSVSGMEALRPTGFLRWKMLRIPMTDRKQWIRQLGWWKSGKT